MLNHIHQWTRPLKRLPLKTLTLTTFTKPSASSAATHSAAASDTYNPDETLKCLKSKGLYSNSLCLKTLVGRLNSVQVDEVIGDLGIEDPEFSVELFYLLKNEHGFRHSRVCCFVVAHVLAGKRRFRELRSLLREFVEGEGNHGVVDTWAPETKLETRTRNDKGDNTRGENMKELCVLQKRRHQMAMHRSYLRNCWITVRLSNHGVMDTWAPENKLETHTVLLHIFTRT